MKAKAEIHDSLTFYEKDIGWWWIKKKGTYMQCSRTSILFSGFYCPEGTAEPIQCPAGTFSNALGLHNVTECTLCLAGYYCESLNLTDVEGKEILHESSDFFHEVITRFIHSRRKHFKLLSFLLVNFCEYYWCTCIWFGEMPLDWFALITSLTCIYFYKR